MTRHGNDLTDLALPDAFCWTKFGTEAGELVDSIFHRKEVERRGNGGVFLWGIGHSIRPSLRGLLEAADPPLVLFSPMKSAAATHDVRPSELAVWCGAVCPDGRPFRMPDYSLVTSRRDRNSRRHTHFALVCRREIPILDPPAEYPTFSITEVRNLRTGSPLGASQVTSVVRRVREGGSTARDTRYRVVTWARLVPPYLVRLTHCVPVPEELRLDRVSHDALEPTMRQLLQLRRRSAPRSETSEQLMLT